MCADVIDFSTRLIPNVLPKGPPDNSESAPFWSASLDALPFVPLPLRDCRNANDHQKRHDAWDDSPGDKGHLDHARGRRYAREAVAAIITDGARSHSLERMVSAIIDRGFSRRGPGGRLCRRLTSVEAGFLAGLCDIAVVRGRVKS